MLVIRMQRTGRKGHAQFRVVVQDSRRTPTSGKIVTSLGFFNPHTKETSLDKEKAQFYVEHGAQPSERVVRLLQAEGVKLPKWVPKATKKEGQVKNADKRRSTRPEAPVEPIVAVEETSPPEEAPVEEPVTAAEPADETPVVEEAPAETTDPSEAPSPDASDEVSDAEETPAEKVDEVATEVAVEEATAEPAESTEQIAAAEEATSDEAAKADEVDATDANQDAAAEPAPEA